jgi:subtilase family serine protease
MVQLQNHVPFALLSKAQNLGRLPSSQIIQFVVPLKVANEKKLEEVIRRQQTIGDSQFGQFLTPTQFAEQFGASSEDIAQVSSYLLSRGVTVKEVSENHLFLSAEATVAAVEGAFQVQMNQYETLHHSVVFSNNSNPTIPQDISRKIEGVVGLNSFAMPHHHFEVLNARAGAPPGAAPGGGLAPTDLKKAYGMTGLSQTGLGQTIAMVEFDGYTASDINSYGQQFGIAIPPLQNVLVDGFSGTPTPATQKNSGAIEVTLDIEIAMALAPASKIMVYEGPVPTTDASFEKSMIDVLAKIATDNMAKVVSISWGAPETVISSATLKSENNLFMQLASQGQSVFVASGDTGAYDDGTNLGVDDPAAQPYVTGVGGTNLSMTAAGYGSETTWANQSSKTGGGGGISVVWPQPSWQMGLNTNANLGSSSQRMVPDVSLDADPATGYAVFYNGSWTVVGGTSCAAPAWAAFTALVNQQRASLSMSTLGFANAPIYRIANSMAYADTFNDIADSSTNLLYPAVAGFDLATGWGTIKGAKLFQSLTNSTLPPTPPLTLKVTSVNP